MKTSFPCGAPRGFVYAFLLLLGLELSSAQAATNKKPQLISQDTNTRALAFESVTMRAEPFAPTMTVPYSTDLRTRVCIFAMNLELLPNEGMNAFTADVQDATGKLYFFNGIIRPACMTKSFYGNRIIPVAAACRGTS